MSPGPYRPPPPDRGEPRRSLRDENRVAVREAILNAAAAIFGTHGFQAAKMTDIAQTAGVAAGTLYNYFASKEEVFSQIVARACEELQEALAAQRTIEDPLQRLQAYLRIPLAFIEAEGPLYAIQVQLAGVPDIAPDLCSQDGLGCQPGSPEAAIRELHFQLIHEAIVAAQAQGQIRQAPADAMVLMLCGIIKSLMWNWLNNGRQTSLVAQTDLAFDLFLNGARAP